MEGKTFLVTGASGFLGYHVCRALLEKEQKVRGIDIEDFAYPDISDSVDFFKGDIRDAPLLAKAAQGADVVIHCAAALPLRSRQEILSVNVDGTRNVLQAAADSDVKRVIFISSTAVYGIPKEHPVDESYPLRGVGPYGESKIEAERACLEWRERGMCIPILRPKTFAGPKRLGVFQILCDWVQDGKNVPIVGSGNNRYQLLHVADLVEAILLTAAVSEARANDTFNVGATDFRTMKADLQALLDYAGFGRHVIPIPSHLVIPVLKALEYLRLSPLYEWIYETADRDHYVSVEKIQKELGWSPQKTTGDVWIDTYKWYLTEYRNRKIETGVSHRVAWKQGVLKAAKVFF
ncbi:MAG: NAD-dependent epimerase/dehydratase family protein [Chloroflexota bacterium]|nr:NAD-dependent epimerase/dehydratase family protein [Chloroflexota bacterium]